MAAGVPCLGARGDLITGASVTELVVGCALGGSVVYFLSPVMGRTLGFRPGALHLECFARFLILVFQSLTNLGLGAHDWVGKAAATSVGAGASQQLGAAAARYAAEDGAGGAAGAGQGTGTPGR